jgi:CBS domain-containing protein
MARDPVTCHPDEEVGAALRRMREHRVRRIPVVDEAGDLKGIVSLADLVRQRAISPAELFDTLDKICEPGKPDKPVITLAA